MLCWVLCSLKVVYAYQAPEIKISPYLEVVNPIVLPPKMKIEATFPDAPEMVRVAKAESGYCVNNHNPTSTAKGCFQILDGTWIAYKCQGEVLNIDDNIACARIIYDEDGTIPWNASKHVWGAVQ